MPDEIPYCDYCDLPAKYVIFVSEQLYLATLDAENNPDLQHCKRYGLPVHGGDDAYFCEAHKPTDA